ncbi:glutathione S-transferase [Marasmius fiardii PR-910]|nr:glutathione S-transferase [Marasmius fiardii PR-910]
MVLKLYTAPMSTCGRRVATVLHEKKIPYELVKVDLQNGQHKTPEYLEKQPFGQVPYIDDDGFILYESRAITRYLELKYPNQGPKLIPTGDIKTIALFEQAASIEVANFDAFASKAVAEKVFKPIFGLTPDQAVFDSLIKQIQAKLDAKKYLAGDELTLADLAHLPYGSLLKIAGSDIMETQGPNVTRWWKELTARESWHKVAGDIPDKLD